MGITRRADPPAAVVQMDTGPVATLDAAEAKEVEAVVRRGLVSVMTVTRSPVAFVALASQAGELSFTSGSSEVNRDMPQETMRSLARSVMEGQTALAGPSTFMGVPVLLGDEIVGMIGVAGAPGYTSAEREAMRMFAGHIAAAIEIGRLTESRQSLVQTLVDAQAELDLSEERRAVAEQRAKSAERLEHAHTLAVQSLTAVSANLRAGEDLAHFYRLLTASVAGLVRARRCLFWQLDGEGMLVAIPGAYGIDDDFISRLDPAPTRPGRTDLTSQIVYGDTIFRAAVGDRHQSARDRGVLDRLQVTNAISAPWRSGEQRLGVIAAYDTDRPGGFTREDAWVLQIVGLAAGLVWQLKHSEAELGETVQRLRKVDHARQLLLRNLSSAVDRATRRLASELHDDALQKLTAAALRLERAAGSGSDTTAFAETKDLLNDVEEALRKVLFNVRPPALDAAGGLEETIRTRADWLLAQTGVAVELDYTLKAEPPFEIKTTVYRQVNEALTNIEKHAAASSVRLAVQPERGGVYASITDDGRGFIVSERDHLPGHLGLLALSERALLAGGWCKVSSEPGAGTIVEFWVPLPE